MSRMNYIGFKGLAEPPCCPAQTYPARTNRDAGCNHSPFIGQNSMGGDVNRNG